MAIVRSFRMPNLVIALATVLIAHTLRAANSSPELRLTPQNALEAHGLSIFLFHNSYHPVFGDQKMSGLEIIFHERRIATNGGMIPGVTVVQPDFPELMNDWPFLWYENEYVVDTATAFILGANCANAIGNQVPGKP